MKLKTTLRRPPWRRKKMSQTHDPGLAQNIGRLIKPRSREDPPPQAAGRRVDPSVYNELVTPRDPALGLGTPDKSQIVYTSRPVVVVCPASDDEPDDDEFGEVRHVPFTLYYDAYGEVIEDQAWPRLSGSWGQDPTHGYGGGQCGLQMGSESEVSYRQCLGNLKARSWVEGEYMRSYDQQKDSFGGTMSCSWAERAVWEVREKQGVKEEVMRKVVDDGEEAAAGRSHSERPVPGQCGGGWRVWEARGRSLGTRCPPQPAHQPHLTAHRTSSFNDPQDIIWASMCSMYPRVAWAGVGGTGEGVWVDPGETHQSGGTRVAARAAPHTPGPEQPSTRDHRRHYRVRDKHKHHRHMNVSEDTKLWCKTGERVAYDGRRGSGGMPSMDQLLERPGCGEGGQCAAQHRLTPAGTTLPGHASAHNLTHIDYDNLRPEWRQHVGREEDVQRQGYCSGVERRQDTVPHTNSAPPSSDDSSHHHLRHQEPRRGPRSAAGDQGRRGEGAWLGGPRVQASGTCGALGQAGPESPVSARTLPRAHARSRQTRSSSSVLSENSASSESSGVGAVSAGSQSIGDTSLRVNVSDGESWWWYQDGVCEGECTCDMPCKVSGIPVYQGRGGDPPRHSREDVPPAAPPGAAGGRGRGVGRRNVGSKTSVTSTNRSPALLGRRGSFGPQGLPRVSTTQDSEVNLQSRTSLSGPGGGQHHNTSSDPTRATGTSGTSSHRARTSPSPSTRSPARGTSPGMGTRSPSPAGPGRTPTTLRRRAVPVDTRTPPLTPLCRRPPPRAVYQVKLSSGVSSRDSPPLHRDKSKLPVMASKSIKSDTSQGTPRTFPPRPGVGRAPAGQRAGKDSGKDRLSVDDGKCVEQAGQASLKLDTPPKSLPLSLSTNSPVSAKVKNDSIGGKTFLDVGGASGTAVTDSDATPDRQSQTSGKTPAASLTKSASFLSKSPSPVEKPSGLLRPGSNRLTSSASRLTSARRNTCDTSRADDSRLDRTLSVSSTHITPKVSVTRTYSGPKSSLTDGANRARIVRRVMNGSRTNLSKKKSTSKTSLVVGRHNLYNRSKSGSKNSLLGSRNNLFRASLDSQRTESTTDSGCNSPMYGSQCSLDGDRKRHSSSPCPNLRKRVGTSSFVSVISKSDTNKTNEKDTKMSERRGEATPPSLPIRTPDPTFPARPEPDPQATVREPDAVDKDIGTDTKSGRSVTETKVCEEDAADRKVKTFHSRYLSGSHLLQNMQKPSVSVKRSSSLQIPSRSRPAPPPKPSPCDLRASSSSLICDNVDVEGKGDRPLPGISVSFRSVSSRQFHGCGSYKSLARCIEKETISQDKREITKVSIVAEPKTREEKGIQVEALSSEEDAEEDEYDLEEEKGEKITCGGSDSQTERVSSAKSQVGYEAPRNSPQLLPGPFTERDGQPTPGRAGKTIARISREQKDKLDVAVKLECQSEIEDNRSNEKKASLGDEENHIIQRLETSLADIIDSAVLKNLKINGNILTDQFDAIIATLKKVAASVDSGDSDSPPLNRRNSDCGVRSAHKTPVSPTTPTSTSSSSSSSMSPMSPSTPRTPPSKTPLSLFSISECYPGHVVTPPMFTRNRKLSLPRDSLQDNSPTLSELARRLHANPNHLRADQDYVDFMDLDQPYVSPLPTGVSTIDLIRGEPTPKAYGRKNSTGSLGLSSCASLLQDKSYYSGGPTSTASVTNLNSTEDYTNLFGSRQSAFRKVHSTSNVNGAVSGGSHRMFQRHLSLCGPDDARAENRLRKSLSKSRELLSQLENEYKKIKGDESKGARNSLVMDQSWLDKDFDELLQTLSNDKTIQSDPHEALAFLTNSSGHTSSCTSSSKSDKWRTLKKDTPPLPMADSPRARRHQSVAGSEGRHIFSFFQKKGRSQSLSGTEAIKIALPIMPEDGPQDGDSQGPRRVAYESATLDRPGRTNRSNSIPLGSPHALTGSGLPLDLVGIFKKSRSKSLSKPASTEGQVDEGGEDAAEDKQQEEAEEDDEPAKQMRSLSLPKSFLSDKYGLTGFKAALPR